MDHHQYINEIALVVQLQARSIQLLLSLWLLLLLLLESDAIIILDRQYLFECIREQISVVTVSLGHWCGGHGYVLFYWFFIRSHISCVYFEIEIVRKRTRFFPHSHFQNDTINAHIHTRKDSKCTYNHKNFTCYMVLGVNGQFKSERERKRKKEREWK